MDSKFCPGCEQLKPRTGFYRNRSRPDGLQAYCRSCTREINETGRRERGVRARDPNSRPIRDYVRDLKDGKPCVDCGQTFPAHVLHFDHVRGENVASISVMVRRGNWAALEAELAKCVLRCANCHILSHGAKKGPKS